MSNLNRDTRFERTHLRTRQNRTSNRHDLAALVHYNNLILRMNTVINLDDMDREYVATISHKP